MKKILLASGAVVAVLSLVTFVTFGLLQPPEIPVPARSDGTYENLTLVEPGRPPRSNQTLRIVDGRIASITDSRGEAEGSELDGSVVTPGLIDMHVHYPPAIAIGNRELWSLLFLAHGVTSIRETGSVDGGIFDVRATIERGESPGPRIFACGRILDGSPPAFPSNRIVSTPDEARAAVRAQADAGADCIKVYNMLDAPVVAAIVDEARRHDLPVIGHAPHAVSFEHAGVTDLQHGTGAVVVDRARIGRLDFHWDDWQSVDDERIAYVAAISLAQNIAHTPTLVNGRMRRLLVDPDRRDATMARDTGLRHLPRFWVGVWESLWGPPHAPGDDAGAEAVASFRARQAALTAGLHRAGARVHAGTDTLMPFVAPGSSLHGELADLVAAGLPTADAWASATRDAAPALGDPKLGTLQPGAPADLLFLRPGPLTTPPSPDRIQAVMADGRLYHRRDLDAALDGFDDHFHGAFYERVMSGVVRLARGAFSPH